MTDIEFQDLSKLVKETLEYFNKELAIKINPRWNVLPTEDKNDYTEYFINGYIYSILERDYTKEVAFYYNYLKKDFVLHKLA